jgi:hypothetical protein
LKIADGYKCPEKKLMPKTKQYVTLDEEGGFILPKSRDKLKWTAGDSLKMIKVEDRIFCIGNGTPNFEKRIRLAT